MATGIARILTSFLTVLSITVAHIGPNNALKPVCLLNQGNTPLQVACGMHWREPKLIKQLLDAGANPNVQDNKVSHCVCVGESLVSFVELRG